MSKGSKDLQPCLVNPWSRSVPHLIDMDSAYFSPMLCCLIAINISFFMYLYLCVSFSIATSQSLNRSDARKEGILSANGKKIHHYCLCAQTSLTTISFSALKVYLGQCKARPFNFCRRLFLFCFLFLQCSNGCPLGTLHIEPCTTVRPPLIHGNCALAPHEFACKLHGYIVYFRFNIARTDMSVQFKLVSLPRGPNYLKLI